MSANEVKLEREAREALAKQRASMLVAGLDLYAYDSYVMCRVADIDDKIISLPVFMCESHTDAVNVILAYSND